MRGGSASGGGDEGGECEWGGSVSASGGGV
jgi:hypothetical protein